MPWCDDCSKYWAPTAMAPDGSCPTCGRVLGPAGSVAEPAGENDERDGGDTEGGEAPLWTAGTPGKVSLREMAGEKKAPWHFKLLVFLIVIYLAWRVVQLVMWVAT
jgi:hypothetical protein